MFFLTHSVYITFHHSALLLAAQREEFETVYFGQFLPQFSAVLAHPVATIAKN